MRCIKPLTLRDAEDRARTVPCGRCNFCLMSYRMDWTIRIIQEQQEAGEAHFLTLTYQDDYLDYSPSGLPQLDKTHLQKFFKRLRKRNAKYSKKSIRYFAIGEYGETYERPHYHAIIFNMHSHSVQALHNLWPVGFHRLGTVTVASIHYVTGYLINRYHDYGDRNPPFAVQSRKPGLGHNYLLQYAKWNRPTDDEQYWRNYTKIAGYTNRLPRYYRDKIFNREERDWLNWTAAQKFDASLRSEIRRLEKLYPAGLDIHAKYIERIQHQHDQIKVTKNKAL